MKTEQEEAKHTPLPDFSVSAKAYATHHSNAPDKCTPDWIIIDFTAGANQCWNDYVLPLKSQLQQLQEENKNLKVDCESYKLTIDLELQEVKQLQEENERMKKQIIPETARQFKINSLDSEVKTLREALKKIADNTYRTCTCDNDFSPYIEATKALQSKGGEQ